VEALAALLGAGGPASLIVLYFLNRRESRRGRAALSADLESRIGSPNGQGNVTEIAERTETKVDDLGQRMTGVEARMANIEQRVGNVESCAKATRSIVDKLAKDDDQ